MNAGWYFFGAFAILLLAAVAVVYCWARGSKNIEVVLAVATLIGAGAVAFLTEALAFWDHRAGEREAAYVIISAYAMPQTMIQYLTVDNWIRDYDAKEKAIL